jgi:ketol-acid reductoisomerase
MEELIKKIASQVGITEEQAKAAVNQTMSYLKSGDAFKETFADWQEDASEKLAELKEDAAETFGEIKEGASGLLDKVRGIFDDKDEKKA